MSERDESGVGASLTSITYRAARRIVVLVLGTTLLLVGVVLLFVPGPGLVTLWLGLAVLAAEFAWARRWLRKMKDGAGDAVKAFRGEEEPPKTERQSAAPPASSPQSASSRASRPQP